MVSETHTTSPIQSPLRLCHNQDQTKMANFCQQSKILRPPINKMSIITTPKLLPHHNRCCCSIKSRLTTATETRSCSSLRHKSFLNSVFLQVIFFIQQKPGSCRIPHFSQRADARRKNGCLVSPPTGRANSAPTRNRK